MKSSTLRRANLSKEKIQVIEALAKYRRQIANTNNLPQAPQIKERELDMLWNNFKQHTKQDKSPTVYLITGFIAGAVVMLIITTLLSLSMKSMNESASDITKVPETKIEDTAITFIPADKEELTTTTTTTTAVAPTTQSSSSQETYTVQNGDTLESIIIRFYGSYSKSHEHAIKEANHMKNPNALQIGQKLIIPLH